LKLSALQPDKIPLKELTTLSLYQPWVSKQRCMNTLDKTRKAQTPIIKSKFQHFTLGYHTHVWTQKTQGREERKNNKGRT
jgi:hypothetical protein